MMERGRKKRKITFRELKAEMEMICEEQKSLREGQREVQQKFEQIESVPQTGPEVPKKKHRRSRKPKFELGKPRQVKDKKKKDKKKKHIVATQIAKLGLEEFPLMFAEIRATNLRLKELISEIDGYILDKLATWGY
ncbi:hypothetical protein CRYUN_Cryun38cG0013200 [Craigia yunnanensis]